MDELTENRQYQTVEVPSGTFSRRMDEGATTLSGSVYSRLALIHRVAKAFATDVVTASGQTPVDVMIDELTDPPLYGPGPDDEPVVIRFSFATAPTRT